jgi:hypothetical protein
MMFTVDHAEPLRRADGSSNQEANYNRDCECGSYKDNWWHCRNARCEPEVNDDGVVLHHGQPCKTNACPDCVHCNRRALAEAVALVCPTVFITINRVGTSRSTAFPRMTKMRRFWRESCALRFETAYVLEHHAASVDLHAHLLGHGDAPTLHQVVAAASYAGVDVADPQAVHMHPVTAPLTLVQYLLKETQGEDTLPDYREVNGRSLLNASRGFWRVPGGLPVGGAEALRRAHRGAGRG